MIKYTYICDRCKAEQDTGTQMWKIMLRIQHEASTPNQFDLWAQSSDPLWCRKCVDEMQLIGFPKAKLPNVEYPPDVTLEDKIRAIVQEEIQNGS